MSFTYKFAETLVKLSGAKKLFLLPEDKILNYARKTNAKHPFTVPTDRDFIYEVEEIDGYKNLIVKNNEEKAGSAILFLYGGGNITCPDKRDLQFVKRLAKETKKDVWFSHYPLCIDNSIKVTYEFLYKTYENMLKYYSEENISFIGFSSGAVNALGVLLYNNDVGNLPMPKLIVAVSPGAVFRTEREKKMAEDLRDKDAIIAPDYLYNVENIATKGEDIPEYMIYGPAGDFSNFPMTHFYYGTHEVIYAFAKSFADSYDKYKAPYKMHLGEGLCHCYPLLTFFPEGKAAQEEIIEILK